MIKKAPRISRHRGRLPANFNPPVPVLACVPTALANKLRLTFTAQPQVSGIPAAITVQGAPAIGFTIVSLLIVDLTYTASVVPTNVCVIPANVQQIRGRAGSYMAAQTVTL